MHLSENLLQEYLDHECSESEFQKAEQHLNDCLQCKDSLAEIRARANANHSRLDVLKPADIPVEGTRLFLKLTARQNETPTRKWKWKPAWAAAFVIAALVAGFSFKPVRAWATEFLSLFRVQQIAVIRIDPANLKHLEDNLFGSDSDRRIEQLFSDDAHVVKHGEPQTVSSENEAARLAGFGIRFPGTLPATSQIRVHPAVDISFSIDVERLQGILDDAGRGDIRVPENLDGEMIRIQVPSSVTALFGKCPDLQKARTENQGEMKREDFQQCKILVQVPSPTVVAPPTLDIAQLGMEMLKLFGLTDEQARKFSESIDWTSTLVIPVPIDHRMRFEEVDLNGVKGNLFISRELRGREIPAYNLMWIRDGILYSLMGQGAAEEVIAIANSM
jgi:Domain of unknown function (DUF4367)